MQISPFFSFKKKQAIKTLLFLFTFILFGCSQSCLTQVSALHSYNGPRTKKSNQCVVIRTALEQKFTAIINEYDKFFQGDSHVETKGSYENIEAAYDCMLVGAKSVLIFERGVISTNSTYINGYTYHHYNPATNQYIAYTTPGDYVSSSTSAYVIAFFNEPIPNLGTTFTAGDYNSWTEQNNIKGCHGCK